MAKNTLNALFFPFIRKNKSFLNIAVENRVEMWKTRSCKFNIMKKLAYSQENSVENYVENVGITPRLISKFSTMYCSEI
ncbi:MAG: hypothetical protein MJ071_03095 [Oscillospiraceae bacterium]|nr:hypothetical protein [Oscillospiraceae bacterium]